MIPWLNSKVNQGDRKSTDINAKHSTWIEFLQFFSAIAFPFAFKNRVFTQQPAGWKGLKRINRIDGSKPF